MAVCVVDDKPAVHVHQRHATSAELEAFKADSENSGVQPDDTDAMVPVYTCEEHKPPIEVAALVHQSDCYPPCSCTPDPPVEDPPIGG